MQIDDVVHYSPVLSSSISQDGRWVVIASPKYVPTLPKRPVSLSVMDLDGEQKWKSVFPGVGVEAIYSPSFSSDSEKMLVFRFSNALIDAAMIRLDSLDEEPMPLLGLPPRPNALKWNGDPGMPACVGEDPEGIRRVWVWESLDQEPTALTPPGASVGDFAFSSTANKLAWLETPDKINTGRAEQVLLHVSNSDGTDDQVLLLEDKPLGYLAWSQDGTRLAFMGRPREHRLSAAEIYVLDFSKPKPDLRCMTENCEGWITGFDWTPDGNGIVVSIQQGTYGRILELSLDGASSFRGPTDRFLSGAKMDRSRGRIIYLQQAGDTPQALCIYGPGFPRGRALTRPPRRLSRCSLRSYEVMKWRGKEGLTIEGLWMAPTGKPPFPTLVWIHGGPAEHVQQTFSPYFQVFSALGWGIFAPNFRGSTGRDNDFLRANIDGLCDVDATDILQGINALVRKGMIDPKQVSTMGWSYGASLALSVAARSKRISSVVAVAPVADWTSIFGARSYPALSGEYFSSELWEDRSPYDKASPITRIKQVKAPVLFLHGGEDRRVPVEQSRLLFRMMKAQQIETDFVVYPGEQHIFTMPNSIMDMLQRVTTWIGKHSRS